MKKLLTSNILLNDEHSMLFKSVLNFFERYNFRNVLYNHGYKNQLCHLV